MTASMETSVGLFKALDVVADEAAAADRARPADAAVGPQIQIPVENRLQSQREQPVSHKAAALIGATTLTGAMLWMNRTAAQSVPPKSAAQKRRVGRS